MTAPRMIIPGDTHFVTRRCVGRQFLLKPDKEGDVQHIFEFCLAIAAKNTGVLIHTYCLMSNHWHAIITDPQGRLPEFMHDVNLLVGKCMNARLGRWESLWSSEKYSDVMLEDIDTLLEKMAYVITNPVAAALVTSWKKWPSAISEPRMLIKAPRIIKRPKIFFRTKGPVPTKVKLELTVPPALEGLTTPEELADLLEMLVEHRQERLLAEHGRKGQRIMSPARIIAQNPFACPKDYDPRKGINPRVACKNKWGRIEMLQRLRKFLDDYREAWLEYKKGKLDVVFPSGTYWMVKHLGATSASPA